VTDGMKLAPANPNFLQARDAIIQADLVNNAGANRGELWMAFAKRGMGANATSPVSSTTTGLVENYDVPDNLGISPKGVTTVTGMVAGPFTPASVTYTLTNSGSASLNWTASTTANWLTVSPPSGTIPVGGSATVTATLNAAANGLVAGSYSGPVNFANTTSGVNQSRTVQLTVEALTSTIFTENWETGTIGSAWTITGTSTHRTQVSNANGPHGGTYHLAMDSSSDGTYARNEATLTLNLTGRHDVFLRFWAKMFSDEADGPPAAPFPSTGADFDGVAISADGGVNWYEVQPLRSLTDAWARYEVDLDAALAARGLSYGANSRFASTTTTTTPSLPTASVSTTSTSWRSSTIA
jgi:hypothetical protein